MASSGPVDLGAREFFPDICKINIYDDRPVSFYLGVV